MDALNLADVFKLPAKERLRIAAAIWDSVADHPEQISLTPEQAQELDARYADFLAHPEDGVSWSEAKSKVMQAR